MPAGAQHVNPTAESITEDKLLSEHKRIVGECTIPDRKACTLEQTRGPDWRYWYQGPLRLVGGLAIIGMIGVVIAFYFIRGPIRIAHGRSGRVMRRFSAFERFVHWMATVCFIILALSGLNLTFGKALLLPIIGPEAFTTISRWGKYAHNYLSFPFTLSVIMIFLMWIRWNLPTKLDLQWMMEGGGFGEKHPPADLFNAGQKSIYWVVVLGGALVALTGYVLMFPFWVTGIVGMQIAQLVHALVACCTSPPWCFTSIWARSARRVRSRACGMAPSMRNGQSSTIRSGTSGKSPRAISHRAASTGRQSAAGRITADRSEEKRLVCRDTPGKL